MSISGNQIRQKYIDFMVKNGHVAIPSAALVPDNDPTTLFTSSGMQPLIPYLMGEEHQSGARLVNSQKCFRADDIEEVGDNRHTTFFEMLISSKNNYHSSIIFSSKKSGLIRSGSM